MEKAQEKLNYFRSTDLEKLNSKMIGRGAPNKKDNQGYNQPDYQTLQHYFFGLSNRQLAEVAKRLIKYCGTQLKLSPDIMKQSALYYYQLSQKDEGEPVSVLIGKKATAIGFQFNKQFIEAIKDCTNRYRYVESEKSWVIHNDDVLAVLQALERRGALVKYAKQYLYEQGFFNAMNIILIRVIHKQNYAEIHFEPHAGIEGAIQLLNKHKYDTNKKCWLIVKDEVNAFLDLVQHLKDKIDIKELKEITEAQEKPKAISTNELTVEDLDIESIAIKIPDNEEIKDAIKQLKFPLKIEKSDVHWKIGKFEIKKLINLLPNNLDTTVLKKFIPPVLSPVKLDHSVYANGPIKPFPHQVEASEFLLTKKRALLADDQGTGKTISTIMACKQIKGKKLIVVPASLKPNWRKEITTVDKDAKVSLISGSDWIEPQEWTVINYDILDRHLESILNANYSVVAFDEAHKARGIKETGEPGTRAAEMVLQVARSIEYCFMLTGTPIVNKVKDLYNILKSIGHPLTYDFYWFVHRYCGAKRTGFGLTIDGASHQKELHEQLDKVKLRRTKEILNLPEKKRYFIPLKINLEPYYKKIEEYMNERQYLDDDKKKLVELGKARLELAKEKVKYAIAYTEKALEKGKSVVLFTNYKDIANEIVEYFGDEIATKINGDCSEKQKDTAVVEFQAGTKKVLVGNYIAAGVGLTLTKSHFMIKIDFDWLPGATRCDFPLIRCDVKHKVSYSYGLRHNRNLKRIKRVA